MLSVEKYQMNIFCFSLRAPQTFGVPFPQGPMSQVSLCLQSLCMSRR